MGIIDVIDLRKYFPVKRRAFAKQEWLKAVDGITFSLRDGEVQDLTDLPIQDILGEAVVRHTAPHHPSKERQGFEDRDAVSQES